MADDAPNIVSQLAGFLANAAKPTATTCERAHLDDGVMRLYVRSAFGRLSHNDGKHYLVIADVEVREGNRANGLFKALLDNIEHAQPFDGVYVENVGNVRLAAHLMTRGYLPDASTRGNGWRKEWPRLIPHEPWQLRDIVGGVELFKGDVRRAITGRDAERVRGVYDHMLTHGADIGATYLMGVAHGFAIGTSQTLVGIGRDLAKGTLLVHTPAREGREE